MLSNPSANQLQNQSDTLHIAAAATLFFGPDFLCQLALFALTKYPREKPMGRKELLQTIILGFTVSGTLLAGAWGREAGTEVKYNLRLHPDDFVPPLGPTSYSFPGTSQNTATCWGPSLGGILRLGFGRSEPVSVSPRQGTDDRPKEGFHPSLAQGHG